MNVSKLCVYCVNNDNNLNEPRIGTNMLKTQKIKLYFYFQDLTTSKQIKMSLALYSLSKLSFISTNGTIYTVVSSMEKTQ